MKHDNPAARLLRILQEGKKHGKTEKCRDVWAKLLSPKNDYDLNVKVAKVWLLVGEILEALKEVRPDSDESWHHWANQVNAAFQVQNMHAEWRTFSDNIDAHSITYLTMTAALLEAHIKTPLLSQDELTTWKKKLSDLIEDVLASEHPQEVKEDVVRTLRKVLTSLEEYQLTGSAGVQAALEIAVGHALTSPGYRSFLTDKELGQRAFDFMNALASGITILTGVAQLPGAMQAFQLAIGGGG